MPPPGAPLLTRVAATAMAAALVATLAAAQSVDSPRASAAPVFSGRYRLVLTFSRTCPAVVQLGPQSIVMAVSEAAVRVGSEVSGQSSSASESPDEGRFVLLRQGDAVHGASGARTEAIYLGLGTLEGYRIWMQIMLDGTAATATGGRSRASGTAFGELDLSRPGDPDADSIGYCVARDHQWALEPY